MLWFFHVKWALNPNKDTAHSNLASKFSYREPNVLFLIPSKIQKMHQKKKVTFVLMWNTLVESPFEDVSYSAPLSGWSLIFFFGNLKCYFWSHQNCTKGRKLFFDILCFVDHPSGESIRGRFPFRLIVRLAGDKWPEHGKEPKFL